jgi:hypothetical protein
MRQRSVEPPEAAGQTCEVSHSPTPSVTAPLAGLWLTRNPSKTTGEPEKGGYLGDGLIAAGDSRGPPQP